MILSLIALPLVMAVALLPVRRLRYVTALLSAGALAVMVAALTASTDASDWLIFGRAFSLLPLEAGVLAACLSLLALTLLYTIWVPQGDLAYPAILGIVAILIASTTMRNSAISTLLLQALMLAGAMLIPSERPGSAVGGMRVLVLLAISGPLLLVGIWATESSAAQLERLPLLQTGIIALALGYSIALGVAPFHVWLPTIYEHGRVLAAVLLNAVLPAALLLHMESLALAAPWLASQPVVLGLMLAGGMISVIGGSLLALAQRTVSRTLGYVAMADLGIVLLGLGLGSPVSVRAALVHLGYRGVALTTAVMGAGVLQQVLGGDSDDHLPGAFRRAPLAMLGVVIGGLSLTGLPLTAGFTTRMTIYALLAAERPQLGWVVVVGSLVSTWAVVRYSLTAWVSTPSVERREPLAPGVLIALLSLALLAVGLWPNLISTRVGPWLLTTLGGAPWQ